MEDKDFETLEDLDINDENTKEEETSEDVNVIKEQEIDDIPKEVKVDVLPNEIGRVKDVGIDNVNIVVTSNLAYEKNLIDHHDLKQILTKK